MKALTFLTLVSLFSAVAWAGTSEVSSPYIEGETLYIHGPIDSHIYDFMAYEYEALLRVKKVSLNSFGGSHDWALLIAAKIKSYELDTLVEEGSYCASACIYLFGVGQERTAASGVWFGVHGARISGGHVVTFNTLCPEENFEQRSVQSFECEEFMQRMFSLSYNKSVEAFNLIEGSGVSQSLREFYFNLNDYETWYTSYNILRKPDLILTAEDALQFNLVTKVIGVGL